MNTRARLSTNRAPCAPRAARGPDGGGGRRRRRRARELRERRGAEAAGARHAPGVPGDWTRAWSSEASVGPPQDQTGAPLEDAAAAGAGAAGAGAGAPDGPPSGLARRALPEAGPSERPGAEGGLAPARDARPSEGSAELDEAVDESNGSNGGDAPAAAGPPTGQEYLGPPQDQEYLGPPQDQEYLGPPQDQEYLSPPQGQDSNPEHVRSLPLDAAAGAAADADADAFYTGGGPLGSGTSGRGPTPDLWGIGWHGGLGAWGGGRASGPQPRARRAPPSAQVPAPPPVLSGHAASLTPY